MTLDPRKDPSCVLAFDWGEGSGNTVYDLSQYGNHGTIYGAVRTRGMLRYAVSLDGIDDYVEIPHSDILNITDEISFVFWIKPSVTFASGDFYAVWDKRSNVYPPLVAWHRNSYLYLYAGEGIVVRTSTRTLEAGRWYHIAITAKAHSDDSHIYIDSEEDTYATSSQEFPTNDTSARIGMATTNLDALLALVSSFRIYNRVLSEKEIKEHYYYGISMLKQKIPSKYVTRPLI